jgi:hypothetical protein
VLQRRAASTSGALGGGGGGGGEATHAAASAGVSGGGGALPHLGAIQSSFGPAHDLSRVSAHAGGAGAEACDTIGADAYATGDRVAFARQPDLHTAAHEAAHVVQQSRGVQLYGGVGEVGDVYERHADAVADRVVAGRSAADLLDSAPGGGPRTPGVQMLFGFGKGKKDKDKKGKDEDEELDVEVKDSHFGSGSQPLKSGKEKFVKGTELSEHKGGTREAKQDFIQLMDGDDKFRAGKLSDLLIKRRDSKIQLFNHLITLLPGDNKSLASEYTTHTGRVLLDDMRQHSSRSSDGARPFGSSDSGSSSSSFDSSSSFGSSSSFDSSSSSGSSGSSGSSDSGGSSSGGGAGSSW